MNQLQSSTWEGCGCAEVHPQARALLQAGMPRQRQAAEALCPREEAVCEESSGSEGRVPSGWLSRSSLAWGRRRWSDVGGACPTQLAQQPAPAPSREKRRGLQQARRSTAAPTSLNYGLVLCQFAQEPLA